MTERKDRIEQLESQLEDCLLFLQELQDDLVASGWKDTGIGREIQEIERVLGIEGVFE